MKKMIKAFAIGVLAFASMVSFSCAQDENVYKVTGASITNEFKENELKAEAKYKAISTIITGFVTSVSRNGLGEVVVELSDDQNGETIIGLTPTDETLSTIATFDKGDKVTFQCKGATKIFRVRLHSCFMLH